jgi:hypothetical protein
VRVVDVDEAHLVPTAAAFLAVREARRSDAPRFACREHSLSVADDVVARRR